MDQESWLSCEKTAVLQGGFLLANQLCQPAPLSALRKEDWERVGRPIVQAVTEICGQLCGGNQDRLQWRKRILCIIWSKVLGTEKGEDVDINWKENPLFPVQNSLPDINHAVLFELVKSMGFFSVYADLLQCFQSDEQCKELERLVKHVTSDCTEEDVKFLLEVWWELMKERREELDSLDQLFNIQCARWTQKPSDCSPQASKRFKPDPESATSSMCTFSILFQGLNNIKENITSSELSYFGLSNCLDMLYTSFLLDHATDLPVEVKVQNIARSVSLKKGNGLLEGDDLTQAIREAQRDLAATLTPAQTKPSEMTLIQAMQTVLGIICSWEVKGLLKMPTHDPSDLAIRLKDGLCRVLKSLEPFSENLDENEQALISLKKTLKDLLASSSFTVPESPSTEMESVVMDILDNNLKGFQDLPKLYASKLSQTFSEAEWLSCLERNKHAFLQKDLVMTLSSTLIAKCHCDADVNQAKKLKDIIVDIFSQLPLPDKNAALSKILSLSKKGLHGFLPSSVTAGYDEEVNLAFNSIIQNGAKSSLSSAVSAVARVAFQNPEATLYRCCHMAVVNLGAHALLAQILQQLPGLRSSPGDTTEMRNKEQNLLCICLQATARDKLSSPQEEDQFLQFLSALMEPSIVGQTEEKISFLPPEEVIHAFILPYFSSSTSSSPSLELCLRLLQCILSHISSDDATPWIMSCSPFPLLYCLAQLLNNCSRCWEQPVEGSTVLSVEHKGLLISILTTLGKAVGKEVALAPGTWSRAISWLYGKAEELDWTVRFHLKEVWGEHFKYEVPSSLMAVCELSEQEWSGLVLPHYGQGTGLLAWVECCCISDHFQAAMLDSLSLNLLNSDEVLMFSKGLMVAVLQTLPWCTTGEWERLLQMLCKLLHSDKLHVPYSLEYVDFLPLLDLHAFAVDLRLSVFLLRLFQLLCGSSCADWLPPHGWAHVGRLCAAAMRGIIDSVKDKVPLPSTATSSKSPDSSSRVLSKEVLFVLIQLFCHVVHVQVMMPGQPEPLFLCALEILSNYEAVLAAYPKSSTALQGANTRHFLTTIADNVECTDMRAVLHQKIAQL
ncbi:gem-associated protein 4 [Pygocentrus nattereri]|uniref:Gem (nuclear organelle) associated protein 4 n=1 Tax=Pygocentrus nattereri TaxID=42514 RepID=A0A3B4BXV4_PYGNA|nr:gem-associated protein 4 [Pygocentrus nattereri]